MVFYYKLETLITAIVSFVINMAIIGTFTLFRNEPNLMELKDAGIALEATLGTTSKYIWAIGLFSSGQSATIAGGLTGQYIMEGFLNLKIPRHIRILISRAISLFPCLIIAKYADIEWVYIFLNIVQFMQLPFVLIPLFKFIENKHIMHGFEVNKQKIKLLKLLSAFFVFMNFGQLITAIPPQFNFIILFIGLLAAYIYVLWMLWNLKLPRLKDNVDTSESFELQSFEC